MKKSRVYAVLSELRRLKWRVTYKGILVGVLSGILVSLYRLGVEFGTEAAVGIYGYLSGHPLYILPWLLLIAGAGWVAYKFMKLEPYAQGSGIPQVEGVVLLGMRMKWYTILIVRYAVGLLTSFFGVSLGREGPSIQIGAAGAQAFAKIACKNKVEKNHLITAGAAAGLSAAFNAPLSGIMFTLEEMHRSFSPNILIAATTAALTGDMVSKMIFGLRPVLGFLNVPQLPVQYYYWLPVIGVISGAVGVLANKCLLGFGRIYVKIPVFLRPGTALLLALPCGLFLPQVLGGGQSLIQLSEGMKMSIGALCLLLIVKLLFTSASFGSGLPGGIFMPLLSMGALTGGVLSRVAELTGLPGTYITVFCVCAMAGVMSGSVKAPITSILLMAEMTGSLVQILPVALSAFSALLLSDVLKASPIYEVLLGRISGKENKSKKKSGALIELPVELGSRIAGKQIRQIAWPKGMLIVSVCRGEEELVPGGNTQILAGDYLVALSSVRRYNEMRQQLCTLCHTQA